MSASTGRLGGARAQYHLRQSFVLLISEPTWTGGRIMPKEIIGAETFTYQSKVESNNPLPSDLRPNLRSQFQLHPDKQHKKRCNSLFG
jgi:hypothetical protein